MSHHIKQRYLFAKALIEKVGETALSFYLNREN